MKPLPEIASHNLGGSTHWYSSTQPALWSYSVSSDNDKYVLIDLKPNINKCEYIKMTTYMNIPSQDTCQVIVIELSSPVKWKDNSLA